VNKITRDLGLDMRAEGKAKDVALLILASQCKEANQSNLAAVPIRTNGFSSKNKSSWVVVVGPIEE
jgi:hypothetical protein